jgi:hypothetical protein
MQRRGPGSDPNKTSGPTAQRGLRVGNIQADQGVPSTLLFWGIAVGLMIAVGGFIMFALSTSRLASLATCVGFGIVLAAFGSRAGGSWGGWSATGAGAMAILLFVLLMLYTPPPTSDFRKYGQIRGNFEKVLDFHIVDDHPLFEYKDTGTSSIQFVVLNKRFKTQIINIQVTTVESDQQKRWFEMIGDGNYIVTKYFDRNSDDTIKWYFDYEKKLVKDGNHVLFKEGDDFDEQAIKHSYFEQHQDHFFLITKAFAAPLSADLASSIAGLSSENPAIWRNSREALAAVGPGAVKPMMAVLLQSPNTYLIKLGVILALNDMLRTNPNQRSEISKALDDASIGFLVGLASDSDKTVRLQATEFLHDLKDIREVTSSLEAIQKNTDPNGVYNNVLILKGLYPDLDQSLKTRVFQALEAAVTPSSPPAHSLVLSLPPP